MAQIPTDTGDSQSYPLRMIAFVTTVVTVGIGLLPAFLADLDATMTAALTAAVGGFSAAAVAFFGKRKVTPFSPPDDNNGPSGPPQN